MSTSSPVPEVEPAALAVIRSIIDAKFPGADPGYAEVSESAYNSVMVSFELAVAYDVRTWRLQILRPRDARPRVIAHTVRPDPEDYPVPLWLYGPPLFVALPRSP